MSVDEQSADIALGVDTSLEVRESGKHDEFELTGAGDQGMMFGYACRETDALMPLPIVLAHNLTRELANERKAGRLPWLRPDGKSQVTVEYDGDRPVRVDAVVISTHARFLFRAERRSGAWRISGFDAIYQRDELNPVIPGQVVAIEPNELKNFRPSYQLLSFCLMSGGYKPRMDLAGIDRPDLVDALTREVHGWAGLVPPR